MNATSSDSSQARDAAELDALADVPDAVLERQVAAHGLCLWEITNGDPPEWTGQDTPDRELAARLCAGCPVRRECLEYELRTAGTDTVGVWSGFTEDDRRALHTVWRARVGRTDTTPPDENERDEGGET